MLISRSVKSILFELVTTSSMQANGWNGHNFNLSGDRSKRLEGFAVRLGARITPKSCLSSPEPDMFHTDSPILLGLFDDSLKFTTVLRNSTKFYSHPSVLQFKLEDVIPSVCLGLIKVSCWVTFQGKVVSDERPDMMSHTIISEKSSECCQQYTMT